MKLNGALPLTGPVSGDHLAAESTGSTTMAGPPLRSSSRLRARTTKFPAAMGSRADTDNDFEKEGCEPTDATPARTGYSSGIAVTTGAWSMPGATTDAAGIGFRDSNRPPSSNSSTRRIDAISGRAATAPPGSLDSLIDRLLSERTLVREMRLNGEPSGWHDSIYLMSWQQTFTQIGHFSGAARTSLLQSLSQAIGDINPASRACEALWQVLDAVTALPALEPASILRSIGRQMHVASGDADAKRIFDRLMQCTKNLPDLEQAKVYPLLLETTRNLSPSGLNHAFISILRATGPLAPAAAGPCIQALTGTLRFLRQESRRDAYTLMCNAVVGHDSGMRRPRVAELVAALTWLDRPEERFAEFSRLLVGLAHGTADDSLALIPALLEGLPALPQNLRMYTLYQILVIGSTQSAATQAANLPFLQYTLVQLERDMSLSAGLDTAALPNPQSGSGNLAGIVAALGSWALQGGSHQYFPDNCLQDLCNWTAAQPLPDQRVILGRLTGQLKLDAALLGCGVQLDDDAAKIGQEFRALVRKCSQLPIAAQDQLVDPLRLIVQTAQDNHRPYAQHMMDYMNCGTWPNSIAQPLQQRLNG